MQHGPRSRQVVEAVRAATLAELARAGFTGVTMDGVARAAGVNRTTLYRRWPTKAALLADVVEPLLARYDADPGTGSLRGDLLALMTAIRDNAARPEGRALIAAAATGAPELDELVRAANARTLGAFHRALASAGERGEPVGDAGVIAHLVFHGVVMWEQAHGAPPGDADLGRILEALLPGRG
ncbi:hypothetical protein GCM10010428_52180 [Actinosynnema pretiosum subsp. pretiosum]